MALPTDPRIGQDHEVGRGRSAMPLVRGQVSVAMYVYSTDGVPVGFAGELSDVLDPKAFSTRTACSLAAREAFAREAGDT